MPMCVMVCGSTGELHIFIMSSSVTLLTSLYGTYLLKNAVVKSPGGGCENYVKASGELQKWCLKTFKKKQKCSRTL